YSPQNEAGCPGGDSMEVGLQTSQVGAFPLASVTAALNEWWEAERQDAALPGDAEAAGSTKPPDIMHPTVEIDSHRAVRALITLEEVLKFEVPETVIKNGGYDDFEQMKEHLIPQAKAL